MIKYYTKRTNSRILKLTHCSKSIRSLSHTHTLESTNTQTHSPTYTLTHLYTQKHTQIHLKLHVEQ